MNLSPIEERYAQCIGSKKLVGPLGRCAARKAKAKTPGGAGNPRGYDARNAPRQSLRARLHVDSRLRCHRHTTSAGTVSDTKRSKTLMADSGGSHSATIDAATMVHAAT